MIKKLLASNSLRATILIRLLAGCVFVSEGIQKFLDPVANGAGRFAKIGIPFPTFFGPFVGVVEIVCGTLLIVGLLTRIAAIPLLIDMIVAIATTKFPILLKDGFWKMAHEGRTDWSMFLACLFLLIVGSGPLSVDQRLNPDTHHERN